MNYKFFQIIALILSIIGIIGAFINWYFQLPFLPHSAGAALLGMLSLTIFILKAREQYTDDDFEEDEEVY